MHKHRFDNFQQIQALDPEKDAQRIVYLVGTYEYPFLIQKSLEFALFRTYAVPSIGGLLDSTRQFTQAGQKRYDDTSLLIAEFTENGYDSERGRAAIRQMNRMHRRFAISNDDYRYVLGTFIFTPIDWHERWGWRKPSQTEKLANYYFWMEVGRRMGMTDLPPSLAAYEQFFRQYERDHFAYTDASRRVADDTIAIFLSWYPRPLHPLLRPIIIAMMDEPLRVAFGYPKPAAWLPGLIHRGLRVAAWVIRNLLPPRRRPWLLTEQANRTYRQGYQIEQVGAYAHEPDVEAPAHD